MFDYLVFIGRFQPFHRAHKAIVDQALSSAKEVILLLGSDDMPRTLANPWFVDERTALIRACFDEDENARIHCIGIVDTPYDDKQWQSQVKAKVAKYAGASAKVGLIGHHKDSSSYYLDIFPDWALLNVENIDHINATDIRRILFTLPEQITFEHEHLLPPVNEYLEQFRSRQAFSLLQQEYQDIQQNWKLAWKNVPYPPIFVTVDAIVCCQDHVLMIERKGPIGKGLWALPGGFIEQKETLQEAVNRELSEETGLNIPANPLSVTVFDHPKRSARGRIITHVYHYHLDGELPTVTAADDAASAKWIKRQDIHRRQCFEDHCAIIETILTAK